jgi:Zn-dependent protease
MEGGVPVARLFGFEIRVSIAWIVLVALVTMIGAEQAGLASPDLAPVLQWIVGVGVATGFLVSVIAHELAHALVGRGRGVNQRAIVLGFLGGLAPLSIEAAQPTDEFVIAVSGPLVSLALGVTALTGGGLIGVASDGLAPIAGGVIVVGGLNLLLGLLSLMPGLPLDGGRIVRSLAWYRSGDPVRAGLATARLGRIVGYGATGLGIVLALIGAASFGLLVLALGWMLTNGARALDRRSRLEIALRGVPVRDAMDRNPAWVGPHLTIDTFADRFSGEGAVSALAVVDHDTVLGVLGVQRVRRLGRRKVASTRAGEAMASPPQVPFLSPDADLASAIDVLGRPGLDGLAVVADGRLEGMLTRQSLSAVVAARSGAGAVPGARA